MSGRLRADFFVAALIRRYNGAGAQAVLGRRGAAEAGAIFILLDTLDGAARLYGPAPQSEVGDDGRERLFAPLKLSPDDTMPAARERLRREADFDPDLWLVEVDDRDGRVFFDLA